MENCDDLTAKDYRWRVEKVFEPISPGQVVTGIVAETEEEALDKVRVNVTDSKAVKYGQERLIRRIARRTADGTWDVSLAIDVSAEDYISPEEALKAVGGQLVKVAETPVDQLVIITIPAECLTVGLFYWIEECDTLGPDAEWSRVDCCMATGRPLAFYLYGTTCNSRCFRIGQALTIQ